MRYLPIAAAFCLTTLTAQEAFQVRQFLPNEHHNVVRVDLEALRDTGLWDELDTGLMKALLGQLEKEAGFPLAALDRLTMVADTSRPEGEGMAPKSQQVVIFEGNRELDVPDSVARNSSYKSESIGIYDVLRRNGYRDEVFLRPRPEVQIYGTTSILQPMLEGRPSAGMPCADILSLLSQRADALLYFVMNIGDPSISGRMTNVLFPDSEWPEGDGLQFLMLRLYAVGDPGDPNIEVEFVLRHGTDGEGLKVTGKAVAGLLERVQKEPQFRLLAPLLKNAVLTKDRTDLSLKLELGTGRTAAGRLTMIALPILTLGTTGGEAQVIEAGEAPAPAPAKPAPLAAPKKKGAGKL